MIEILGWALIAVGTLTAAPKLFKLTVRRNSRGMANQTARAEAWDRFSAGLLLIAVSLQLVTSALSARIAEFAVAAVIIVGMLASYVRKRRSNAANHDLD
jgi:hypothetical protein